MVELRGFAARPSDLPASATWHLELYRQDAGRYGTPVPGESEYAWAGLVPALRDAGVVRVGLSPPAVLGPGTHWLAAEAEVPYPYDGGNFAWYWFHSSSDAGLPFATFSHGFNFFGSGTYEDLWINSADVTGGTKTDLGFKLEGRTASACP